jgi:hypothetical protein
MVEFKIKHLKRLLDQLSIVFDLPILYAPLHNTEGSFWIKCNHDKCHKRINQVFQLSGALVNVDKEQGRLVLCSRCGGRLVIGPKGQP